jgi:hypothetical protein
VAWRVTLSEYDMAIAGHNQFHGGGKIAAAVDHDRMRRFIEETKEQYPDNLA